jgi:prepilin-type N-terminal cleavage/methylation domain-containing protein
MKFYRNLVGRGAFSLLEVAVVAVVLGVVAAIVSPRMSRGAASSPQLGSQVLVGQLRSLRAAVHAYADEHGGHAPDGDADRVTRQLTQYTDWSGNPSPARTARHNLGPYLREIPPLPVGSKKGLNAIRITADPDAPGAAWLYDPATLQVRPAVPAGETDTMGREYNSY